MELKTAKLALLVRAIEARDLGGRILTHEARREADALLEGESAGAPSEALARRARHLMGQLHPQAAHIRAGVKLLPRLVRLLIWGGALLSLILGMGTQSLGAASRFHVLSATLIGITTWNLFSMGMIVALSVYTPKGEGGRLKRQLGRWFDKDGDLGRLLQRAELATQRVIFKLLFRKRAYEGELQLKILLGYLKKSQSAFAKIHQTEIKRWLHLMSLTFALGVLLSAYWAGLDKAYLASTESTFISLGAMEVALTALLWPATLVFGAPDLSSADGGSAAMWIHRYAVTLFTLVIAPRLGFVWLETWRLARLARRAPVELGFLQSTPTLNVALASHTNVGKTSLARTLLRRDVGEVRDAEHVTQARAGYLLINAEGARLRIWDTPGFGDAAALLAALEARREASTIGGALKAWRREPPPELQGVDLEAAEALEDEADLVLYLAPACPSPAQLEEIKAEWRVLEALGRPTLLILNRVREGEAASAADLEARWRAEIEAAGLAGLIRGARALDAFHRTLEDERAVFALIHEVAPEAQRDLAGRLLEAWEQRQAHLEASLSCVISEALLDLHQRRVPLQAHGKRSRQRAQEALVTQTQGRLEAAQERILDHLGLEGARRASTRVAAQEAVVERRGAGAWRGWGAGIIGVASGVASGITAEALEGGFGLGGGVLLGGLIGALVGASGVELYRLVSGRGRAVRWSADSLRASWEEMLLFTLSASAHGRAMGAFAGAPSEAEAGWVGQESWAAIEAALREAGAREAVEAAVLTSLRRAYLESSLDQAS